MPDVFTRKKRSEVMSRIRSRGNRDTELALKRVFRAHGITGWRRHVAIKAEGGRMKDECLKVRPDFVFRAPRVAVFVDGCFWHGCPLHATRPRGNAAFWKRKLERNRERDREVNEALRRNAWRVLRIWEHELARVNAQRLLRRIRRMLAL